METILFYTPGTCSLAGIIALEWLGEPFHLCRVEKEDRSTPAYLRINPRAQVPALRVDGKPLVEANAILSHIAGRRPDGSLLPRGPGPEADLGNQWLAYLGSGFHPVFWPYFAPQKYTTDPNAEPSVRDAAVQAIRRELTVVNAHLEHRPFVLGETRSVLDGYLHAMDRWANKIVDMPKEFPSVFAHQKAMAKDPGTRFGMAIERGDGAVPPSSAFLGHVALSDT